jgi:hypothetical protein
MYQPRLLRAPTHQAPASTPIHVPTPFTAPTQQPPVSAPARVPAQVQALSQPDHRCLRL